jgi:hypothetical protein
MSSIDHMNDSKKKMKDGSKKRISYPAHFHMPLEKRW